MADEQKVADAAAEADKRAADIINTSQGGAVALSPEQLAMMAGDSGKQQFSVREMMVPVLKICNTSSGVMKRAHPDFLPAAIEGHFVDSLTHEVYAPPIKVIIARFETTYIESKPNMGPTVKLWGTDRTGYDRAAGGDVGARSTSSGTEIREVGTYYSLLLRPDGATLPCLMYLGSTSWREARRLNALLASLELIGPDGPFIAPPYGRTFEVTTVPEKNEQNAWMTWKFNPGSLTFTIPNGVHLYKRAKDFETAIDKKETRIVGTADDERFAERQSGQQRSQQSSGPPRDDAPPPESEGDYGGGTSSHQQTIGEKAKNAPF